jgi:hypothetical protein
MPGLGISLGLGIGPRSGGGGGTPPPSVSLAMGDTYGYVGDGIPSEGAASGICGFHFWLPVLFDGFLLPVPVPHLAVSGTSICRFGSCVDQPYCHQRAWSPKARRVHVPVLWGE